MNPQPKQKRWISKKYEAWIKEQPCCSCGHPETEPHHIKGIGGFSGVGIKASSVLAISLCRICHDNLHRNIDDHREVQLIWTLKTIESACSCGVLKC